jgi:hypothetical protein
VVQTVADDKLIIQIELDDGTIKKGFLNIQNNAERAGDNIKKSFDDSVGPKGLSGSLGKISTGLLAIGAVAVGAGLALKKAFSAGIDEAIQAENAINRLSSALAIQGNFSKEAVTNFQKYADTLSTLTGIDDDLIVSNAGLLASLGGLSGQGLEKATKAALDLAQATGKDLGSVTQALAKATDGSTEALSRYGVRVSENIPKSERFAAALEQIQRRFGGLAETRLNTFEGSLDLVGNKFNDVLKVFGELVTQSPVIRAVLKTTGELLASFASSLSSVFANKDPFGELLKNAIKFSLFFVTNILPPFEIFFNFLKTGSLVIGTFATGLVAAFANIGSFFITNVVAPFLNFFTNTAASVIGVFSKETADRLREVGSKYIDGIKVISQEGAKASVGAFETVGNALVDSAGTVLDSKASTYLESVLGKYQKAVDDAKSLTTQLPQPEGGGEFGPQNFDGIKSASEGFVAAFQGADEAVMKFANNSQKNFKDLGATMFQTLGQGAGNAFAAFGRALAKGQNGLKAFAGALLGMLGQAAIQMGSMFILQGLAYTFGGFPNGPALIAAGAALAALGGVLSAFGGGGESAPSTSVGASASGPATLDSPELSTTTQKPAASNTIIVQGDVFDSDNTGSRIVDLLRQYTDKNGETVVA